MAAQEKIMQITMNSVVTIWNILYNIYADYSSKCKLSLPRINGGKMLHKMS